MIESTFHDSLTMNDGSIVGLPNSSSDEEDSGDELARAGDALCRTLMQEQEKEQDKKASKSANATTTGTKAEVPASSSAPTKKGGEVDEAGTVADVDAVMESYSNKAETTMDQSTNNAGSDMMGASYHEQVEEVGSFTGAGGQEISLEERVQELETKLATLSRILQQQQRLSSVGNLLARSPTGSKRDLNSSQGSLSLGPRLPAMPLMEDMQMDDGNIHNHNYNGDNILPSDQHHHDDHHQYLTDSPPNMQPRLTTTTTTQKGMVPYLESPAPIDDSPPRQRTLHQRKRLSFHLLYDGNEDNLALADDDNRAAMAAALNHHHHHHHINPPPLATTNGTTDDDTNNSAGTPAVVVQQQSNQTPMNGNFTDDRKKNDQEVTTKEEGVSIHPLQRDVATTSPTSVNGSTNGNHSTTISSSPLKESPRDGNKSQSPSSPTKNTLADVAARVVEGDTNTNNFVKDTITESSSNHSSNMDGSKNSSSGSSKKKQPTTPTNNGKAFAVPSSSGSSSSSKGNEEQPTPKTLSPVPPPGGRAGARVKAAILPPLILSKDKRSKWLDHLNSFQESNHDVDRQMQEFIKVPGAVEKTLASGLLICVDSFLYVCTILPIRFAWSCVLLSLHYFFKWTNKPPGNYQFHRRHMYQLIQVSIIFFIYRYILLPISIGKLYHWIRGQAMIKLYVVIAIVEVFDRLMCSLGQDCLDSLYWNTTRRPRSSRMLISVSVVMVYTAVHSLILFVHVATLNVAMNSADEALLALLIGGNFAEIKSTVFKKYNKPSLFKIVASDICERFKLALFLGLILLLNFCQGMDSRKLSDYRRIATIVWMSELLCDWLKHSFITKFNFIPSTVYPEYGLLLAGDVTGIGHEGVNLDHSHAVVKRIGFAQMPLVCVTARLVREAAKYMSLRIDSQTVPFLVLVLASAGCWILLLSFKIFLGAYLQRTSLAKLHAAPELSQTPLKAKQK